MDFHRKSIRLDRYDYSSGGCYFVTIDVQDKLKLFWGNDFDNNKRRTPSKGGQASSVRTLNQENKINQIGEMIDY